MLWSGLAPPPCGLRDVVVVPVRNEAERLDRALIALASQEEPGGRPVDPRGFEVLLLANNCDDESAAIASRFAATHPRLQLHVVEARFAPAEANIGHVRRMLMDEACRRLLRVGRDDGLILSTDGDTEVTHGWLAANRREAARGADAVGGRILTDGSSRSSAAALRTRRLDLCYSLWRARLECVLDPEPVDVWPRHHQHFGASLAVTANAYRRAGGVPRVEYLEDEALYRALCRTDAKVRHSPAVRVVTSSRLDGRAPVGLSWQLRQWADGPIRDLPVEAPRRFAARLAARATLRSTWRRDATYAEVRRATADFRRHESDLGLPSFSLERILDASTGPGAAIAALEQACEAVASEPVPMTHAIRELRSRVVDALEGTQSASKTSSRYRS